MGRSRDAWHSARLRIIPTFLSFTLSACVWIAISTYRTNLTRAMMNEPKQTVPMCESSVRVAAFVIGRLIDTRQYHEQTAPAMIMPLRARST